MPSARHCCRETSFRPGVNACVFSANLIAFCAGGSRACWLVNAIIAKAARYRGPFSADYATSGEAFFFQEQNVKGECDGLWTCQQQGGM